MRIKWVGGGDRFLRVHKAVTIGVRVWIDAVSVVRPLPNVAHAIVVQVNHLGGHTQGRKQEAKQNEKTPTDRRNFPAVAKAAANALLLHKILSPCHRPSRRKKSQTTTYRFIKNKIIE